MSGSTRKPTIHLSLVRENGQGARFCNLETLAPEQRDEVYRRQRIIAPSSVLVGVVLGTGAWDIRPVLLHKGVMTITRMFSPQLLASTQLSDTLKSYVFHVEGLNPGLQALTCGSADGHSWVTRKYFNRLLSDPTLIISPHDRVALLKQLLADIEALQRSNLVHGHLHPTNIAYEDGRLVLLDHGFQIYDPSASHPPTMAPELRSGLAGQLNATGASDMYGLGLVAKRLFGADLGLEFGNLIEVLMLTDPKLRPRLSQVSPHFLEEQGTGETPSGVDAGAVPKIKRSPVPSENSSQTPLPQWLTFYLPAALSIGLALYLTSFPLRSMFAEKEVPEVRAKYAKYWSSAQPALMQQVVAAALKGDVSARNLLLEELAVGSPHPAVQTKLLAAAQNPAWEDEFSTEDTNALLTLALTSLVPRELRTLPDFQKLHPGIVVAMVGNMSIDPNFEPLSAIPLERLERLPSPYGSAFMALAKLGVKNLQDPAAQALSHILIGDQSPAAIQVFLYAHDNPGLSLAKLELLTALFDVFTDMDVRVFEGVSSGGDGLFSWFAKDIVAQWSLIGPRDKLQIFTGRIPAELSVEQKLDLLRFPRANVREQALAELLGQFPAAFADLLKYLADPQCALTRTQSISLVSLLQLDSAQSLSFVQQWFDTAPNADAVARVFAETTGMTGKHAFFIEGARFLLTNAWKLEPEPLVRMAMHPEPLVRTLAYSRLRIDVPEEKGVLAKLAEREPLPRIKEQLLKRLAD